MTISTIRPGVLVALSTSLTGNVKYGTKVVDPEHLNDLGAKEATWETTRTILDPEEHDKAVRLRGKCRGMIRNVCSETGFGLLCPDEKEDQLQAAIQEAQRLARDFNATANITRLNINCLQGRIMPDDEKAVREINREVTDLLNRIETGVRNMDADVIRENANKARAIGTMLSDDAAQRVKDAVASARAAARRIANAGEQASLQVDKEVLAAIANARTAFLDLEGQDEIQAPVEAGRGVDLMPDEDDARNDFAKMAGAQAFRDNMQRVVPEQWQNRSASWLVGYDAAKGEAEGTPNDPRETSDFDLDLSPIEIGEAPAEATPAIDLDFRAPTEQATIDVADAIATGAVTAEQVREIVTGGNLLPAEDPRIGRYEVNVFGTTNEFEVVAIDGDTARTDFGPMPLANLQRATRVGDLSEAGRRLQAMGE